MKHMASDEDIWRFIRDQRRFVYFNEVKAAFPEVHNQKLTNILKRLEKDGELVRYIGWSKSKPVNNYLAVDLDDPGFTARIIDDHGWVFAIFEWRDSGDIRRSASMDMGELANYIEQVGDELILRWPSWAIQLADASKLIFADSQDILRVT